MIRGILLYIVGHWTFTAHCLTQEQVDNGVPVATCLYLFGRWVRKMTEERGVVIMEPGKDYTEEMSLCALATWSGKLGMVYT